MDPLTFAASVASLTGINIRHILKFAALKRSKQAFALPLFRLLSVISNDQDELTGHWSLAVWRCERIHKLGYTNIWGDLLVLFKYPDEEKWRGTLILTYSKGNSKSHDPTRIRKLIERIRGGFFRGAYRVELRRSNGQLIGTTSQIYRSPDNGKRYDGEFQELKFDASGGLVGTFANTGVSPSEGDTTTEVRFHQRRLWKEVDAVD